MPLPMRSVLNCSQPSRPPTVEWYQWPACLSLRACVRACVCVCVCVYYVCVCVFKCVSDHLSAVNQVCRISSTLQLHRTNSFLISYFPGKRMVKDRRHFWFDTWRINFPCESPRLARHYLLYQNADLTKIMAGFCL